MSNILVGHSSFYLRNNWLKKGVEYVSTNNQENVFSKNNIDAIDYLGIGSVMVQSLRFWMNTLDILTKDGKEYKLKREILEILKEDPYLQSSGTLWLLHTYIMDRDNKNEKPVLWDLLIKEKKQTVFSEEDIKESLISFYKKNNEVISDRSLKDSISVFIKLYYRDENEKIEPEDNLYSPFTKLNYLNKNEEGKYYFRNINHDEINEEIIFLLLKRELINSNKSQITISDFYNYINGIINMTFTEYNKIISKLENRDFITVDRAAGLQNINIIQSIKEKELIKMILERE